MQKLTKLYFFRLHKPIVRIITVPYVQIRKFRKEFRDYLVSQEKGLHILLNLSLQSYKFSVYYVQLHSILRELAVIQGCKISLEYTFNI